ncbi:SAM-dependent methyltransferase [Parafilimonas sp.]|uniref:SAM-dependent methyltransferase n=1 Tax=Parafilimonas sp. TaxID=1969739 RepID=UPI003F80D342
MPTATIYLVPIVLHEDEIALQTIPSYIINAVKQCNILYAENERTARRFLKKIWKEIDINAYTWHTIHKAETEVQQSFKNDIAQHKTIGIMSEAGCPGIADPGQMLVHIAQQMQAKVIPLVGPNSIILALMASGMNGQSFQFVGYLPVDAHERKKKVIELENESIKKRCTQIFIETPYRNNQLVNDILTTAKPETQLCIAVDITASTESIQTKKIKDWKKEKIELHKMPAIFLLYGNG